MSFYYQNYLSLLKKKFMLLIIAVVLLIFTFFIWAGVPVYVIGNFVANMTSNPVYIYLCIAVSGGFLFSLYFLPINFKFAKHIANVKELNPVKYFIRIQVIFISLCSLGFVAIYSVLVWSIAF